MPGPKLTARHARGRQQEGERYDPSELDSVQPEIRHAYETGARVRVEGPMGTRTGTIGCTTGWRPAFLLMHRSSDIGSWDVLGPDDKVTAVKRGSTYVKV